MKGTVQAFTVIVMIILTKDLRAQGDDVICDKDSAKIYFTGKAPKPWAIDGNIKDWKTLLGPFTGNDSMPFRPPKSSAFNWARDGWLHRYWPLGEADSPSPGGDIIFNALTNDDYNVYFYLRRLAVDDSIHSFFYFCDINLDGFMNYGEPVFYGSFKTNKILSFCVGMFVPDSSLKRDTNNRFSSPYILVKGNDMANAGTLIGYHMPGEVKKVFDSKNIPPMFRLRTNEIFSAKMTEQGRGIEFSIPWKYFRYLNNDSLIFKPNDVFAYRIAIQKGGGQYKPLLVEDDAFSCTNSLPVSDNGKVEKKISITKISKSKYKFSIAYTNPTNGDETVTINHVLLSEVKNTNNTEVSAKDITLSVAQDSNCNDHPDSAYLPYKYIDTFQSDINTGTHSINFDQRGDLSRPVILIPAHKQGCFIVYLSVPTALSLANSNINFKVSVRYVLHFIEDPLYGGGYPEDRSGDVNVGIDSDVNKADATLFPWPPPAASTMAEIKNAYFKKAKTLDQVKTILDTVLSRCGYEDKSYYLIPNGFAVITRIEQIKPNGYSLPPPDRWSLETKQDYLSFIEKVEAEFNLTPGYFRVFAFIITNKPFMNNGREISRETAIKWANGGYNKLPNSTGNLKFSKSYNCTALIYEYQQPQVDEATLIQPSNVSGQDHLINAGVITNLQKKINFNK